MSANIDQFVAQQPETKAFWEGAREGRLLLRYCTACAKPHWYPRTYCPFCSEVTEWKEASGRATLYSYSVTRKGDQPHIMAFVSLEEGPTMMTNIVDCDPAALSIGQPVRVTFRSLGDEGPPVPLFVPA